MIKNETQKSSSSHTKNFSISDVIQKIKNLKAASIFRKMLSSYFLFPIIVTFAIPSISISVLTIYALTAEITQIVILSYLLIVTTIYLLYLLIVFIKNKKHFIHEISSIYHDLRIKFFEKYEWYNEILKGDDKKGNLYLARKPCCERAEEISDLLNENAKPLKVISVIDDFEFKQITPGNTPITEEVWKELDVEHVVINTSDFTPVDISDLNKIVDAINKGIEENKNVIVHCNAGVGRSAMGVAAYLINHKKMKTEDAVNFITERRPQISLTKAQAKKIKDYENSLKT
jgi:protein-tyrosine phosphatase